ncbi:MAG: PARP-type zinc finger-containing protein, partial [Halieaceae bacterium]
LLGHCTGVSTASRLARRPPTLNPTTAGRMEAFVELVIAPTNRATCAACKRYPLKLHKIEKGELVLKSNYVPVGRNHFQSSSTSLSCITQKRMRNMLGDAGSISKLHGFDSLPPEAQTATVQLADCILANAPIDETLKTVRFPIEKKRKRRDPGARTPTPEPEAKLVETVPMPDAALHIFGDPADAR